MASTSQGLIVPPREATEKKCACGCAPCEGTCCHLDCIVQPRFFCGQLLTDGDLTALLKWARDRFALSRYRHGWGVVCGLDVRCDPQHANSVIVTPGYAVDCCGDDIIICEDATLDLSAACREEKDPCADLRRYEQRIIPSQVQNLGAELRGRDDIRRTRPFDLRDDNRLQQNMRVVDVFLRYDQQPSEPTTALGRSSCKQVSECEYSRTRESYKLTWEFGVIGSDPLRARAERWLEGYEKCLDVLKEFRYQFSQRLDPVEVRRWLLHWIDTHPQYHLCNLGDAWCRLEEQMFGDERFIIQVLFQLVQNCRNLYLNCDCFGCDEDAGIPLARVWLVHNGNDQGNGCHVVVIDPYPPYRRPIQPECWPAPLGYVNVGRFIWHRWQEVCTQLSDLGVRVRRQRFQLPATLAELERRLSCDLFVECGETREALIYDAGPLGERVVGFCTTRATSVTECPEIAVDCPSEARPGETIRFDATITGGDPTVRPGYYWEVNGGTIVDGQGTSRIVVEVGRVESVTAAVAVGGYDRQCPTDASCTTRVRSAGGESRDDFTSIDFIGPSRDKKLHAAGINTFRDLAQTPVEKLKELFPDVGEDVLNQWTEDAKRQVR